MLHDTLYIGQDNVLFIETRSTFWLFLLSSFSFRLNIFRQETSSNVRQHIRFISPLPLQVRKDLSHTLHFHFLTSQLQWFTQSTPTQKHITPQHSERPVPDERSFLLLISNAYGLTVPCTVAFIAWNLHCNKLRLFQSNCTFQFNWAVLLFEIARNRSGAKVIRGIQFVALFDTMKSSVRTILHYSHQLPKRPWLFPTTKTFLKNLFRRG